MTTREKMKAFFERIPVTQEAVAEMVGTYPGALNRWLNDCGFFTENERLEAMCENFLEGQGKELLDLQDSWELDLIARCEFHRKRSVILSKVKVHPTTNQRVPSLV